MDRRASAGAVVEARTASTFGRWIQHRWRPAPDDPLRAVVREIVHWDGRADRSRERLFPGPTIELVVHVGAPHALVADGVRSPLPAACVSGLQDNAATIEAPVGHTSVLCIRLRPPGAYSVLAVPLDAMRGRTLDLRDCVGRTAGALAAACEDSRTADERIRLAVGWLRARISHSVAADPAVEWATREIERNAGAVSVTALRSRTGFSRSHFASLFRQQVGVSAKRYARIVRFRRALSLLHWQREPSLSLTALEAGYYDQSHMNADFREFAGVTPGEFLSATRPTGWVGMAEPGG